MKKLLTLALLVSLLALFCLPLNAQVLWRSAKCMKKGQFIAMGEWFFFDYTNKYLDKKWEDNSNDQFMWGFDFMFGYAPLDNWELMVHVPYLFKGISNDTGLDENVTGAGDIYLKTRYGIIPWSKDKHGLALLACLRLPTGIDDEEVVFCNCGDGTIDYSLAGIFSTAWRHNFRGHLKINYWINGENEDKIKPGNELKFILKLDRNFSKKIMAFTTYIYYNQADKEDHEVTVANTDKIRHNFVIGGVYKPIPGLFIRPKVVFPIDGKNGVNATVVPKFDIWYVFNL